MSFTYLMTTLSRDSLGGDVGSHGASRIRQVRPTKQDLMQNLVKLAAKYPPNKDGTWGLSKGAYVTEFPSDTPLETSRDFWGILSKGATVEHAKSQYGPLYMAKFGESITVVWRPISASSSRHGAELPVIQLNSRRGEFPLSL